MPVGATFVKQSWEDGNKTADEAKARFHSTLEDGTKTVFDFLTKVVK